MSRRVSLPRADDLFRPTATDDAGQPGEDASGGRGAAEPASGRRTAKRAAAVIDEPDLEVAAPRRPSGRVRHDEKMTVYVTSQELLDIEQARLLLRAQHGLAVDRGRLVREALAIALADLEAQGEESVLVSRLRDS